MFFPRRTKRLLYYKYNYKCHFSNRYNSYIFYVYNNNNYYYYLNRSYLDLNNQPVYEWKKIVIHYLTGWFVIDLISTIPWNLFFTNSNDRRYTKLVRLSKLLRIIRLIRVFKINHIFKQKTNFGISDV